MDVIHNTQGDHEKAALLDLNGKAGAGRARAQKGLLKPIKRCPECFSNLPMDTKICPWCNQRVKASANRHGYAKKPINWYAYLTCLLSWLGVAFYIWWAFF